MGAKTASGQPNPMDFLQGDAQGGGVDPSFQEAFRKANPGLEERQPGQFFEPGNSIVSHSFAAPAMSQESMLASQKAAGDYYKNNPRPSSGGGGGGAPAAAAAAPVDPAMSGLLNAASQGGAGMGGDGAGGAIGGAVKSPEASNPSMSGLQAGAQPPDPVGMINTGPRFGRPGLAQRSYPDISAPLAALGRIY